MANSPSAEKRIRTNARRRARNRAIESRTKTLVKKFKVAAANDDAQAPARYSEAASALDRAANRGVIHPNKAARVKSRMARQMSS